jgi:6-pyruvoyltetrahydropterin/6-carboxytetrahydropterin synthase
MTDYYEVTREIGIDAAHRVPDHKSKCQNVHGHRYRIEATVKGPLIATGEQSGMVIDFGFLKDEMMEAIDGPADHAMIMYTGDPLADKLKDVCGKLLEVDFIPTAENLAAYWFNQLAKPIENRTQGYAWLSQVKVWETPNCFSCYPSRD